MIVLIENKGLKVGAKMGSRDIYRKFPHYRIAIGRLPTFYAIQGIAAFNFNVLNHKILISLETASFRNVFGGNLYRIMKCYLLCFAAFSRTRTFEIQ